MLVGILKMIFGTSKGGIERWKLTEVEEQIFIGDCRGVCIHEQNCENEAARNIL